MPPQVRELRAVLSARGGQRYADMAVTRDNALQSLGSRDARIRELQDTVNELNLQLHRQAKALAIGASNAHGLWLYSVIC